MSSSCRICSARRSAAQTKLAGPFNDTCRCSTSPKSRLSDRAALRAAWIMTLRSAERSMSVSVGAADVGDFVGVDHDLLAGGDERRHHDAQPVLQPRRLVGRGGGLSLENGVRLHHFEHHVFGQANADGAVLMHLHVDGHAVLQEGGAFADEILGQLDLLIGVRVHEHELVTLPIEELEIPSLDMGLLDFCVAAEALVELAPVKDVLQFHLIVRGALAGLHRHGLDRNPQRTIVLDHEPGPDVAAADLRHGRSAARAADLKFPHRRAARSELQIEKRHENHILASGPLLPKFVSAGAANITNFGTGHWCGGGVPAACACRQEREWAMAASQGLAAFSAASRSAGLSLATNSSRKVSDRPPALAIMCHRAASTAFAATPRPAASTRASRFCAMGLPRLAALRSSAAAPASSCSTPEPLNSAMAYSTWASRLPARLACRSRRAAAPTSCGTPRPSL